MKYTVEWIQTLVGEFEVEANSEEEAIDMIRNDYDLDIDEVCDNQYRVVKKGGN